MNVFFLFTHCISTTGDQADLIFVFFDPIGQALCKRTLNLVENLNTKHADRIRFYLSKADEAGHESDRQVWIINANRGIGIVVLQQILILQYHK